MTTESQLAANRRNAKLGGVRTSEGKAVSKYNALRHSIFRQALTEYDQEFSAGVIDELEEFFTPGDTLEAILVERIALCYLKLFRIQKAETEYMLSRLNPRVEVLKDVFDLSFGELEVLNEGYSPRICKEDVLHLCDIYGRYENTMQNRMYRAMHELERVKRMKRGENVPPPLAADVTGLGSFGEK